MSPSCPKRNCFRPVAGNGFPRTPRSDTRVGILSLQGDFSAHARVLEALGADPVFVRRPEQLDLVEGLIIPGGESTTMLKLVSEEGLLDPLVGFAARRPLLGTCAGSILMAADVTSPRQPGLGLVDISIERNAYGRQVDSAIRSVSPRDDFLARTGPGELEAVFIRAPIIRGVGNSVHVLAEDRGHPILVEQGRHLAATFHPELSPDRRVHQLFLLKIRA